YKHDLTSLENSKGHGLGDLRGQRLKMRSRKTPEIECLYNGQAKVQKSGTWMVVRATAAPGDESVELEHGQQSMCGGRSHPNQATCFVDSQDIAILKQAQKSKGVINGLDRILRRCG